MYATKIDNTDSVGMFLREIGRYPLLEPHEEIELAKQVAEMMPIVELRKELKEKLGRDATIAELAAKLNITELELTRKERIGQRAKQKMVASNMRWVVAIAKRYTDRGVPFLDLVQEGAIGLNRAAEKFDPSRGLKFSTYSYHWIRQGVTRTIANDSRTIRLPIHVVEKINKLKKAYREFRIEHGRTPNQTELAAHLNITVAQLHELMQYRQKQLSLNNKVGEKEDNELIEVLADTSSSDPIESVEQGMLAESVRAAIAELLTPTQQRVINLRFGLEDGQQHTLEQVGIVLGVSRERVRQIEQKARRKLREAGRQDLIPRRTGMEADEVLVELRRDLEVKQRLYSDTVKKGEISQAIAEKRLEAISTAIELIEKAYFQPGRGLLISLGEK